MNSKVATAAVPDHVPTELVFDHYIDNPMETMVKEPFALYKFWREKAPDIFYVPSDQLYGRDIGAWVVQRADLIREVFQDGEVFLNRVGGGGDSEERAYPRMLVPLELDPPEHGKYRQLLAREFSPKMIKGLEGLLSELSLELIQAFADRGEADFMTQYARIFPIVALMQLVGFPLERREEFLKWEHRMFRGETSEIQRLAGIQVAAMVKELIAEKLVNPGDDLLSQLVNAEIDGEPIAEDKLEDMGFLLFLAGLDTVTAGMGHIFRYLAEHPDEQQRLRDNPELINDAIEELLRYFSWIRLVVGSGRIRFFMG